MKKRNAITLSKNAVQHYVKRMCAGNILNNAEPDLISLIQLDNPYHPLCDLL